MITKEWKIPNMQSQIKKNLSEMATEFGYRSGPTFGFNALGQLKCRDKKGALHLHFLQSMVDFLKFRTLVVFQIDLDEQCRPRSD